MPSGPGSDRSDAEDCLSADRSRTLAIFSGAARVAQAPIIFGTRGQRGVRSELRHRTRSSRPRSPQDSRKRALRVRYTLRAMRQALAGILAVLLVTVAAAGDLG